ncbi:tripartite tricarboxylate transporter permease [Hoeflea sp. 108]|jgi:putative tricarboxylic transport membrane protein|uniref:tripartite tricarboxylate transporter permease n=1 Tax=Hoeflea sp. 108 TaxID=1116369 RepID=UPI0003766C01|nr:tripartite tricarboxylate transporter permease [Hoeflea sp. 108]
MSDVIWSGFASVLSVQALAFNLFGVVVGIIFGVIPGLSAATAIALFLPITFGMEPVVAIALMMGLYIGASSGGFIAAILLNIPGKPSAVATTFDGYPMARNGEAGRALGASVVFSFIGGLISMFAMLFIAPPLSELAMKFGPIEYFAATFAALMLLGSLTGDSLIKGLLAGLIGLMLALVGSAPIDYTPRFDFGFYQLSEGFPQLAVLIGMFAIAEVVKAARRDPAVEAARPLDFRMRGFGISLKETIQQMPNAIRSSVIGIFIGILPALGGTAASLVAYTAAKNASKEKEKFGKGSMHGLVASETANNAVIGGDMIPLLTLGIPGDVVTALLLGALTLHGLTPGPLLLKTHGDLLYAIFAALMIANVMMLVVQFFGIRIFVRLLSVKKYYLFPIIVAMCAVGAFSANNVGFDVVIFGGFGVVGWLLLKGGFPFAPVIVGFILGPLLEINLRRGLMTTGGDFLPFFQSPIALVFFATAALLVGGVVRQRYRLRVQAKA